MNKLLIILLAVCLLNSCSTKTNNNKTDFIIADGEMPNLAKDKDNNLHLVYGIGDSIFYSYSSNHGKTFSAPSVISVLPGSYSFATRGPQVATVNERIIVTACTSKGDIFSFYKEENGKWAQGGKVNDADTTAKEGLMALSSDVDKVFAIWLDLRTDNHNKIYGAGSTDGGKTWLPNKLIYSSPDTTVCECCKPSVIVKDKYVYVMFRNWLHGNRDLYLIKSNDDGNTFGEAQKLGTGNWKLNGCPMDGGAMALNNGVVETVWRRQSKVFASTPGMPEKEIGEGKSCTMEVVNGKKNYAWTENGAVVVITAQGQKEVLGKGSQPILKALNNEQVICIWENDKQIHASVLKQ